MFISGNREVLISSALVTFLLLAGGVFGATSGSDTGLPDEEWAQVFVWAGMIGVLFFIGKILISDEREMGDNARKALNTLFYMVLAAFAMSGGVDMIGGVLGVDYLYDEASSFLNTQVQETTEEFVKVLSIYEVLQVVSSFKIGFGAGWSLGPHATASLKIDMADIMGPINSLMGMLVWSIWGFVASMSIQKILLEFGHNYAMSAFLPLGILFFILPGLNRAGGLLISIAIGMWLLFPLTVNLILMPAADMVQGSSTDLMEEPTLVDLQNLSVGGIISSYADQVKEMVKCFVDPTCSVASSSFLGGLSWARAEFVQYLFGYWAKKFMIWYLVPIINLLFFVVFVINMTDMLGGEEKTLSKWANNIFRFR